MGKGGCVRSLGPAASVLVLLERQASRENSVSSPSLVSDTSGVFSHPHPKLSHTPRPALHTPGQLSWDLGTSVFGTVILSSFQFYDHSWPWDVSVTAAWIGSA